ncbi:hypothetical protein glysoja_007755 [Glycine soja]|nr:hypothetical protein glysoja_007755 [Glycine soja]
MQNNSSTKATSKLPRRAKSKKRDLVGVNDAQVAETPSEFSFAVAKIAVAQVCHSVGFKTFKCNALKTLTNVSTRYLETIVRSAASFANASNRTNSNLFDIINGIHDLCSAQGFPGGSVMHKVNLLRRGNVVRNCGKHSLAREENNGLLQINDIKRNREKDTRMELPKGRERMKF